MENTRTVSPPELLQALLQAETPFEVRACGAARVPKSWGGKRQFVWRGLDDHLLWGIREGELRVNERGGKKAVPIPAGAVMWVHAEERVLFSIAEGCPFADVLFFRFSLGAASRPALARTVRVTCGIREMEPRLSSLIAHAKQGLEGSLFDLQLRSRLADLLADLIRFEEEPSRSGSQRTSGLSMHQRRQCLGYIQRNIRRFFSLREVADYCRLNPAYLSAQFRKSFGVSFQRYVKETRIREAKSLLLETFMSITEVAAELGYQDIYYFSRQFKASTGRNPRQWRAHALRAGVDSERIQ